MNQMIDNREAGRIGIHTFTNAGSFTVGETDTKIISIEFAASEEVMAQFFGSVIVSVEADPVERSASAKGEILIPSVEVEEIPKEAAGVDAAESSTGEDAGTDVTEEGAVTGRTKEQTVSVELPVVWQEDGEAVVHFTFEFNDEIIGIHQPEETWHSGRHSILLYYPIEKLTANYRNIFNVYMRVSGGLAMVETGDCLAGIMGQSMGAGEAWDGEIRVTDSIRKVRVGGSLCTASMDERIAWKIDELVQRSYRDVVHGRTVIGAFAMPVE